MFSLDERAVHLLQRVGPAILHGQERGVGALPQEVLAFDAAPGPLQRSAARHGLALAVRAACTLQQWVDPDQHDSAAEDREMEVE